MPIVGQNIETEGLGKDPRDPASWATQDARRVMRIALHVSHLQDSTVFYSQALGLTLVAALDIPGASVQRALVAPDLESTSFAIELLAGGAATVGDWSGHIVLAVPDRATCLQRIASTGKGLVVSEEAAVIPLRNPSPSGGRTLQDIISIIQDPNGYHWHLVQTASHHHSQKEQIVAVGVHVPDISFAIAWCVRVLGMLPLQQYQSGSGFMSGLVGFDPERVPGPIIELIQGEPSRVETGLSHIVVSTTSLDRTFKHLGVLGQTVEEVLLGGVTGPTETVRGARLTGPGNLRICFIQSQ